MSMPAYIYYVEVVDLSDFSKVVARKVCKSKKSAEHWGMTRANTLAHEALLRGEDLINFDWSARAIEYLDN